MDILEWCGFKQITSDAYGTDGYAGEIKYWVDPVGNTYSLKDEPTLDMNFFFRYVMPKVRNITTYVEFVKFMQAVIPPFGYIKEFDPNEAWQEALIKLMEGQR